MDGYHPKPPKALPRSIHELQRILHEAGHARLAAIERMRKIFSEGEDCAGPAEADPRGTVDVNARDATDPEAALAGFIREAIERDGASFVFAERLGKVWPVATDSEIRYRAFAVREFASRHGWEVFLTSGGQMAMFRGAPPAPQ